ncbi:hypothetical protein Y032_0002g932 [Ancylostoma ceylanicum]|uniref:Uncharacterized protein n=1 Tax=Ancylostoma ceylanicum TaxID=53326 RepID=A0A016W328_9BILA|nr:hypothetical protein Y032_0002g932 [Ancylostoma ceylanicum]
MIGIDPRRNPTDEDRYASFLIRPDRTPLSQQWTYLAAFLGARPTPLYCCTRCTPPDLLLGLLPTPVHHITPVPSPLYDLTITITDQS